MGLASGGKGCLVLLCPLFTSKWTGKGGGAEDYYYYYYEGIGNGWVRDAGGRAD